MRYNNNRHANRCDENAQDHLGVLVEAALLAPALRLVLVVAALVAAALGLLAAALGLLLVVDAALVAPHDLQC